VVGWLVGWLVVVLFGVWLWPCCGPLYRGLWDGYMAVYKGVCILDRSTVLKRLVYTRARGRMVRR